MLFKDLDEKTKKQIKASMKRICSTILKLNIDNLYKIDSSTAYLTWTTRYIAILGNRKFYNLIELDAILDSELRSTFDKIFLREKSKLQSINTQDYSDSIKKKEKQNYRFRQATPKQLYYASYLMNMIKNKPLPKKNYTMAEIGTLINMLKKQFKA
jgi:hypothetical protein